jgi:hypothetical protein
MEPNLADQEMDTPNGQQGKDRIVQEVPYLHDLLKTNLARTRH